MLLKTRKFFNMAKIIPTILLNDLQIATLAELKDAALDNVVKGDVVARYKQNVIGALIRHGALKVYREKHFKLTNVNVARRPDITPRKPKIDITAMPANDDAGGGGGAAASAAAV